MLDLCFNEIKSHEQSTKSISQHIHRVQCEQNRHHLHLKSAKKSKVTSQTLRSLLFFLTELIVKNFSKDTPINLLLYELNFKKEKNQVQASKLILILYFVISFEGLLILNIRNKFTAGNHMTKTHVLEKDYENEPSQTTQHLPWL